MRPDSQTTPTGRTEGQIERGTTLTCEQCLSEFIPKNRNGIRPRFCSRKCLDANRNARRLRAAAAIHHKKQRKPRGPSKHAQQVSQTVFLALVPVEERAELLRAAAERLGITDQDRIHAALRRAAIPNYEATA
jgi:endogenous inhibitor of DNA gyrase (YacG/DUF329 family)